MQEALERLYGRRTFGVKLGLHVEQALLKRLGNPEQSYGVVHVAGTNGKGSVCALVAAVLKTAGFRTGLYTSPHLVRLNERIVVDSVPISDSALQGLLERVEKESKEVAAQGRQEPTFFEFVTALAFEHFRREKAQIAVVETGMGGRLDATNVVTPLVSVITGIGLDHMQYLGPDLASIAREKCGIIKAGRPVVCGGMDEAAMEIVRAACRERQAPLTAVSESVSVRVVSEELTGQTVDAETGDATYGKIRLPLAGRHQASNLATALATVEAVGHVLGMKFPEESVKSGIGAARWPGRFQIVAESPTVILDGAHNPQAAGELADTLKRLLKKRPVGLVFGMCGDKDVRGFLKPFAKLAKRLWIVPVPNERNMAPSLIRAAAAAAGLAASEAGLAVAMEEARQWARDANGVVCVTGSLFLVGEVLGGGTRVDPN